MTLAATLAALAMATAPMAYAQTAAAPHDDTTTTTAPKTAPNPASDLNATPGTEAHTTAGTNVSAAAPTQIGSDELRASKIIGSTVYDQQNKDVGSVKDIVLGRDGKVSAVVLDVGSFLGMGGKYVAVKMADLRMDNDNRLTLGMTKDQLKEAQAYQLDRNEVGSGSSTPPGTAKTH